MSEVVEEHKVQAAKYPGLAREREYGSECPIRLYAYKSQRQEKREKVKRDKRER